MRTFLLITLLGFINATELNDWFTKRNINPDIQHRLIEELGIETLLDLQFLQQSDLIDVGIGQAAAKSIATDTAALKFSLKESQWYNKQILCHIAPEMCGMLYRFDEQPRCVSMPADISDQDIDVTKESNRLIKLALTSFNQGQTFSLRGEWSDAITHYQKALSYKPMYGNAFKQLGISYFAINENQLAFDTLSTALKLMKDNTVAKTDVEHYLTLVRARLKANAFIIKYQIEIVNDRTELFSLSLDKALDLTRHQEALDVVPLILEFGVFRGDSTSIISDLIKEYKYLTLDAFDSFQGLPEKWKMESKHPMLNSAPRGTFAVDGVSIQEKLLGQHKNLRLHVGLFQDTLKEFLENRNKTHGKVIGYIHIDCDLYSATKYVLSLLSKYLRAGSIIQFDELIGWPGWDSGGEYLALEEMVKETDLQVKYLYTAGQAVTVVVL